MRTAIMVGALVSAALLAPNAHADPTWDGRKQPHSPSFQVHSGIAHGHGKHHKTNYCVDDDHMCLPGNPEGKPAGCYDEGGVIVALWPCHLVRLDPIHHPDDWDVQADPGSPDYDQGQTYDDPDEPIYTAGYSN